MVPFPLDFILLYAIDNFNKIHIKLHIWHMMMWLLLKFYRHGSFVNIDILLFMESNGEQQYAFYPTEIRRVIIHNKMRVTCVEVVTSCKNEKLYLNVLSWWQWYHWQNSAHAPSETCITWNEHLHFKVNAFELCFMVEQPPLYLLVYYILLLRALTLQSMFIFNKRKKLILLKNETIAFLQTF